LARRSGMTRSGQIHGRQRALSCPPVGSSYWPRMGIFMSACGHFFMSADSAVVAGITDGRHAVYAVVVGEDRPPRIFVAKVQVLVDEVMCVGVQPRQEIKDDPASGRDLSRGTCARTEQPCDPPTLYGPLAREGAKVDDRNAQTRSLPARTDRWRSHIDCLIECRQRSSETRGVLYTPRSFGQLWDSHAGSVSAKIGGQARPPAVPSA